MQVARLRIDGFRNLADTTLTFESGVQVLHGHNGQGKTNLLEALYLLATLRSFRSHRLDELVRWGEPRCLVEADIVRRGVVRTLRVEVTAAGRRASLDGKRPGTLLDYFGQLHVVLFSPEDLAITKGEPLVRRQFLDRAVFNAEPAHLDAVREYERALRQRNALLRQGLQGVGRGALDVLAAFDAPLVRSGAAVVQRRAAYLRELAPLFGDACEEIGGRGFAAELRYESSALPGEEVSLPAEAELAARLEAEVAGARANDIRRGHTTVGPHKDELVFLFGGRSVRQFASQGQHRACVLALKVAEIRYLQRRLEARPVLLLDDVSSELDATRNEQLMRFLDAQGGQVWVSTTDRRHIRLQAPAAVWWIEAGQIRREP